ncbi:MAG: protoheme IX farnesyltransferase [Chloroflexi bacterium]|nr:protoheme IX farnesyltransferase [Chloroflexota bacterium]
MAGDRRPTTACTGDRSVALPRLGWRLGWFAQAPVAGDSTPSPAPVVAGAVGPRRTLHVAGAYLALMKPRIIVLLLITTLTAMVLAQNGWPPTELVLLTMLGGFLAAGGANAINQYLDRDIDELMRRTRRRPLPSHQVAPARALAFGIALGALAFALLAAFVNLLAAFLAITGLLVYVIVYTLWLKRSTPQNIVIGGAAGAIPPLVGWVAVTGDLSLLPLYLFAIIFFWTPPHFWALSLLLKRDYAAARVPMLPVIAGEAETKRQILLYSLLLVALSLLLFATRLMGFWYLAAALLLGVVLLAHGVALQRGDEMRWARRTFFYSNAYLALLFAAMIVDQVVLGGAR